MVNHISPASPQFQDYLKHGEASPYSDMFVKWEDIWPGGECSVSVFVAGAGRVVLYGSCCQVYV